MGNRSVSDTGIAGFVINPRNGQPVLIEWDGERVDIYRWKPDKGDDVSREGRGYFERGSDEGAELSNYPRVHTPSGVSTKGQGFGTTLYTGLCLVAHGAAEGKWRIPPYEDGDGISSTPGTRSAAAEGWWDKAVELNVAIREEYASQREDVEVAVDPDDIECMDEDTLRAAVDAHDGGSVGLTYVNSLNVDIEVSRDVDVMHYERAYESNLVMVYFDDIIDMHFADEGDIREVWQHLVEVDGYDIGEFDEDVFVAMDVRFLPPQAVNLFAVIARTQGVDEYLIEAMRIRNQFGLDPDADLGMRQQLMKFTPNGPERQAAGEALELTALARKRTGWKKLRALP